MQEFSGGRGAIGNRLSVNCREATAGTQWDAVLIEPPSLLQASRWRDDAGDEPTNACHPFGNDKLRFAGKQRYRRSDLSSCFYGDLHSN